MRFLVTLGLGFSGWVGLSLNECGLLLLLDHWVDT